jgi:hypothetical protein
MYTFVNLPRLVRSLLFFVALTAVVFIGVSQPALVARADPAGQSAAPAGASIIYLPLLGAHDPKSEGGEQPAPLPGELVGGWSWGGVNSTTGFYNPNTGQFAAPSSAGGYYLLNADGTFEEGALLVSSLYNCTMKNFFYQTGTYSVQGDTITFSPQPGGIHRSEDTCHAEFNYEQPYVNPGTYHWQISQDEQGIEQLILTGENGEQYGYTRDGAMAPPQPPVLSLVGVWGQGGVVNAASVYDHARASATLPSSSR